MNLTTEQKARLFRYTENENGCWVFDGWKDNYGYGTIEINGKRRKAHRVAFAFANQVDVDDLNVVAHSCDNPGCIRPDHLRNTNQAGNMKDKMVRGRYVNGQSLKTHCKRGHELSGDNVRLNPKGARVCRACMSMHSKAAYALKKNA